MKKKLLSILAVVLTVVLMLPVTSSAAPIAKGINLTSLNNDVFGQGYSWDNLELILTLDSLDLNTSDATGILLPAGSTIILNGNSKITAASYGIQCLGALTVKGEGTLTVAAAVNGISGVSSQQKHSVVFRSGTVNVNGAKYGIYTENSELVFSGSTVNIKATEAAVFGKNIKMVSGSLNFEGKIKAKGSLSVSNTKLSVTSSDKALEAALGVTFTDVDISAGDTLSSVDNVTEYNGQKAIKTIATKDDSKKGFLFGGKLPAFVDYIVLSVIILGLAAVIVVPIIIKRKKTAKLVAEFEAAKKKTNKK